MGNLPPSVYWRRRILVIGSVVLLLLLLVLTVRAVTGGGGTTPVADGSSTPTGASTVAPTTSGGRSTTRGSSTEREATARSSSSMPRTSAAPKQCAKADLAVQAVVGKSTYKVGDKPVVELQVTNVGAKPCIQDLADQQVVLKVYNGESRVWGSHDCEVQKGTNERTLPVRKPVRVSITWSGQTSQEGCKGTRQRVGVGTYTLYATLAGKDGKAAQFSIS
ncbi:hypothetical protein [Jatrophihabitans fulvus]